MPACAACENFRKRFYLYHARRFGAPWLHLGRARRNDVVEGVALDGLPPRRPDQTTDVVGRHRLRRPRPGHVVDLLLLHGPIQIVHAEPQGRLRDVDPGRDPEGLHVRDVVDDEPRDRVNAERVCRRRRRQLAHLVVVRMKRERDERLKAARLVLQRARAQHVVDSFGRRLDMAVQHRHIRAHAQMVRDAVDREPSIRVRLVVADFPAHALGEDLRAAPRQRIETGGHQLAQHLLVGHAVQVREERDLDGGKTLQVNRRPDALQAAEHLRVVLERQIRVQAVDDVDLGERLIGSAAELPPDLFERHRVGIGVARLQPRERAEQAARDADVRRFDPDVVVVVGPGRVAPFTLPVGEPAEREQIGRVEQPHAIFEIETDAGVELLGNVRQPRRGHARAREVHSRSFWHAILRGYNRRSPGGRGKWVRNPRGAATVSALQDCTNSGRASQDTRPLGASPLRPPPSRRRHDTARSTPEGGQWFSSLVSVSFSSRSFF